MLNKICYDLILDPISPAANKIYINPSGFANHVQQSFNKQQLSFQTTPNFSGQN